MSDQGSNTTAQAEGEAPTVNDTPADAVDVEALKAQIAAATAKIDSLEQDNAKYRQQRREAKEANEAAMKKAGEFEPLLQERDSTIAELQAKVAELEPDALARREWLKAEEQAIDSAAQDLDAEGRALVAALPLEQRRAAIARLGGVRTKERPPEHPAANPSPPSAEPGSIPRGIANHDPSAWAKIKEGLGIPSSGGQLPSWAQKG